MLAGRCLEDDDWRVRWAAAAVLGQLGAHAASAEGPVAALVAPAAGRRR